MYLINILIYLLNFYAFILSMPLFSLVGCRLWGHRVGHDWSDLAAAAATSAVKASAWNAGDPSSISGSGRFSWRRKKQPTPVLLPAESHGQRSLVGYNPWCCKQSDTTERLHSFIQPKELTPGASSSIEEAMSWNFLTFQNKLLKKKLLKLKILIIFLTKAF